MSSTFYYDPDRFPFPDLKNMKQREKFILQYHTWPIWCSNEFTDETFYHYVLPDGYAIVVRTYPHSVIDGYILRELEGVKYYLCAPGKRYFEDCRASLNELKNHLSGLRTDHR